MQKFPYYGPRTAWVLGGCQLVGEELLSGIDNHTVRCLTCLTILWTKDRVFTALLEFAFQLPATPFCFDNFWCDPAGHFLVLGSSSGLDRCHLVQEVSNDWFDLVQSDVLAGEVKSSDELIFVSKSTMLIFLICLKEYGWWLILSASNSSLKVTIRWFEISPLSQTSTPATEWDSLEVINKSSKLICLVGLLTCCLKSKLSSSDWSSTPVPGSWSRQI